MSFIMKRFFVFVLGLSCMSIISLLAVEENPLIKRELFLISNSGFENNLENWDSELGYFDEDDSMTFHNCFKKWFRS